MSDDSEEMSNGRLKITGVTKEDAGEYECENPENGDKRRVRLIVLNSADALSTTDASETETKGVDRQMQSKYRREVEAPLGGSVEMYCEYKDEAEMTWRKVDGVIHFHFLICG